MSHFGHQFEENYLKELYKLSQKDVKKVNNTALAKAMALNPATVLEMVRKLSEKGLVELLSDKSIQLTEQGKKKGLLIIRKHRLWEVFLVSKLKYRWSEVHDLAEQLEHVGSEDLINRLEEFLGYPAFDPHGDPIPDRNGKLKKNTAIALSKALKNKNYQVVSFADTADSFLDYLSKLQIEPGTKLKITDQLEYDGSFSLTVQKSIIQISEKVASNILVQPVI
ncbi:MAG TPA: metal-dependent transcriptional regulator [Flavisolibacter sp.]|jgi:DtxR family Mn-dependent transcriptional regulator|nr:metal-dependent transcriptional regulator [Flavisolibacter sp.]